MASNEKPLNVLIEAAGGAAGGWLGARLPDMIDPPTSPRHRSIGHGIIPTGSAGYLFLSNLNSIENKTKYVAGYFPFVPFVHY